MQGLLATAMGYIPAMAIRLTPAIPHLTATATPHLTATATPRLTGTATPRRTWATPDRTPVTRRISATPERSVIKSGSYAIRALPDFCFGITSELRLGVKLIFPPDHSDHLLGPRFQRPGLSLTLCAALQPRVL